MNQEVKQRKTRGTGRYKKARAAFLAANPLCAGCEGRGIKRAAEHLDHIVPVSRKPELFWKRSNWQGLCRTCHENKTAAENRRTTPDQLAWNERLLSYE